MATHETIRGFAKSAPSGRTGDAPNHMPKQFGTLYLSAYEAGYRQGFRDGFADGNEVRKNNSGGAAVSAGARTNAEENSGPRLLGLPCTNCGCFFYSDLSQCPRCKTPK